MQTNVLRAGTPWLRPKNWPVTSRGFGTSNGSSFSIEAHGSTWSLAPGAPPTSLEHQYQASTLQKWDSGDSPRHFLSNSSNPPVNVMRRLILNNAGISCDLELDLPHECIHIIKVYISYNYIWLKQMSHVKILENNIDYLISTTTNLSFPFATSHAIRAAS